MTPTHAEPAESANTAHACLADLMHTRAAHSGVLLALLAANLGVFLAMLSMGAGWTHNDNGLQLAWGANFGPATQDGQWWRLATAMFLHFGIVHLGLNMWALWDVGRLMERLLGHWRFAVLYLGSGVLGNLLSLVMQGNQAVSGGASGAVFGLYGALLTFLWRERRHVQRHEFRWLSGAAFVFTLLTLGMGQVVSGIDNAAHVGGLLGGALLGQLLARPWAGNARPVPWPGRALAGGLLLAGIGALATHIPAPSYRMGDELRAQQLIRKFLADDRVLSQRWDSLLDASRHKNPGFDQLASAIDAKVAVPYQQSLEQLTQLQLQTTPPTAQTLDMLRKYAKARSAASHAMVEGLRAKDPDKVRKAMEAARQAPLMARAASAPAVPASGARR